MYYAYQPSKKNNEQWAVSWYGQHSSNVLHKNVDFDTAYAVANALNHAYEKGQQDANNSVKEKLDALLFGGE